MFMHPDIHIWLQEQDRERAMTQHALERAARAGDPRPGLVRGGISSFARLLRRAAGRPAGTARPTTSQLTGASGA